MKFTDFFSYLNTPDVRRSKYQFFIFFFFFGFAASNLILARAEGTNRNKCDDVVSASFRPASRRVTARRARFVLFFILLHLNGRCLSEISWPRMLSRRYFGFTNVLLVSFLMKRPLSVRPRMGSSCFWDFSGFSLFACLFFFC